MRRIVIVLGLVLLATGSARADGLACYRAKLSALGTVFPRVWRCEAIGYAERHADSYLAVAEKALKGRFMRASALANRRDGQCDDQDTGAADDWVEGTMIPWIETVLEEFDREDAARAQKGCFTMKRAALRRLLNRVLRCAAGDYTGGDFDDQTPCVAGAIAKFRARFGPTCPHDSGADAADDWVSFAYDPISDFVAELSQ